MVDPEGDVGLTSLRDLCDLLDEDIDEIVSKLGMNIGERKRLQRGIIELRADVVSRIIRKFQT